MQIIFNILFFTSLYLLVGLSVHIQYSILKWLNINISMYLTFSGFLVYQFRVFFLNELFVFVFSIFSIVIFSILLSLFTKQVINKNNQLIISIGIYVIFQNLISVFFGDDTKTLNMSEIVVGHQFLGAYITTIQIITIVVSALLFGGMFLLYNYTNLGKQIRAVSENAELSSIYGISANKIILISVGISSALGAIAGILSAMDTNLTPTMGFNLLLYGIVAMIIGGVGSFRGLLLGSLLVASAQNLVAFYLDTKWMDAVAYIILIVFLLWKPLGFSGKRLKKIEI